MKKPGPFVYLFGNPVALLAAFAATAFFGYRWWSEDASLLPAVVAFLVFCQTMNATGHLQKYNEWKREWDAMEGKPSAGVSRFRIAWTPATRFLVGVPAWAIGAYAMLTVPMGDDLPARLAKASFWLGTALMVVVLIYRALPRRKRAVKAAPAKYPDVTVCVPVPRSSPSLRDVLAQLPDCCRELLK
jgi:hypothetical protein